MSKSLCVMGSWFGSAGDHPACSHCYVINTGVLVGIIIADIILTVLITVSVFCFAMQLKRQRDPDSKINSSSVSKTETEETESPYQELHGVQSDVYSELDTFRK